jgi:serine O-acetyltransferase
MLFENVREDLRAACITNQGEVGVAALLRELLNPGTQSILVYRLGHWLDRMPVPGVRQLLRAAHLVLQYVVSWRVGIFIPVKARIGPGLVIHTWGGGVFLPQTRIGRNVIVIGGGVLMDFEVGEIGDEVSIGAGAKVVGKVRIGNRVRLGPNCVVQSDVPDDCVAFGNPARVIGPVRKLTRDEGAIRFVPAVPQRAPEGGGAVEAQR